MQALFLKYSSSRDFYSALLLCDWCLKIGLIRDVCVGIILSVAGEMIFSCAITAITPVVKPLYPNGLGQQLKLNKIDLPTYQLPLLLSLLLLLIFTLWQNNRVQWVPSFYLLCKCFQLLLVVNIRCMSWMKVIIMLYMFHADLAVPTIRIMYVWAHKCVWLCLLRMCFVHWGLITAMWCWWLHS